MYIRDFRYHAPETVEEACDLLATYRDAAPLAGGTDLLVELKQGKRHHEDIVSLTGIPELKSISLDGDRLSIGANVTHTRLKTSSLVREHWPAIGEATGAIATTQIRNTATVGGNLCTAASCSDTAPILLALEAELELVSSRGKRSLSLEDFFIFHHKTALEDGEILTRILVPLAAPGTGAAFEKFGLRDSAAVAVASLAARVGVRAGLLTGVRIVMGAVAPTPRISRQAAELLEDTPVDQLSTGSPVLEEVGRVVAREAEPIDDIRGSAEYRRQLLAVLTQRVLVEALGRAIVS
jgi:carbon-monoxide dehydrogenase medium subunit